MLKDLPIIEDLSLSQQGDVLGAWGYGSVKRWTKKTVKRVGRHVKRNEQYYVVGSGLVGTAGSASSAWCRKVCIGHKPWSRSHALLPI